MASGSIPINVQEYGFVTRCFRKFNTNRCNNWYIASTYNIQNRSGTNVTDCTHISKFLVSQESKTALNQLSGDALSSSLDAAEELLKRSVNQADHDRLADEYLDQIGPALKQNAIGSSSEGAS